MDKDELSSPEQDEITQIIAEGTARIDALEQEINNVHSDSGLVPKPSGFGASTYRDLGDKNLKRSALRTQQAETRMAMSEKADQVISRSAPEQQAALRDQVAAGLQPKDKEKEQKETDDVKATPKKDINDSQDYAHRLLLNRKLENKLNESTRESKNDNKTGTDIPAQNNSNDYSSRLKLNYSENKEDITGSEPGHGGSKTDKDRDE